MEHMGPPHRLKPPNSCTARAQRSVPPEHKQEGISGHGSRCSVFLLLKNRPTVLRDFVLG